MKRLLTAILGLGLLFGCSGGGSTTSTPVFEGRFVLLEIVNVDDHGTTIRVVPPQATGELIFKADGTFTGFLRFPDLRIAESGGGTFVIDGTRLFITDANGPQVWEISTDRNRITSVEVEVGETTTFVFVRA